MTTAMAFVPLALSACQPTDDVRLVYDVSNKKFFVAQWGDWRRFVNCPHGLMEATVPSAKPRRRDTRVAQLFSDPMKVTDKKFGLRNYHRASFYECKRA